MKCYSAAIIGLGQIGQGYDYNITDNSYILTHASGFTYHKGFELIAAVDPDEVQRKRFEKKFDRPAYMDLYTLFSRYQPEVIAIAVPTAFHYQVFQEVIKKKPRTVLCEKPIATCVSDACHMLDIAGECKCTVLVNYMRRFEPGVLSLKQLLQNEEFGDIYKGTVWYSKGLLNNGSHFVDLLRFLLADVTEINILKMGRKWGDNDYEPDVCIYFGNTPVYFLATRDECFSICELSLIGTKGMIWYTEGGAVIKINKTQHDPVFPGYTILSKEKQNISTDLMRYQWYVLESLYCHLTYNTPLESDGKSAVKTLQVIEKIFELLGVEKKVLN